MYIKSNLFNTTAKIMLFFSGQELLHLHNIGVREGEEFFPFGVDELVPLREHKTRDTPRGVSCFIAFKTKFFYYS